MRTIKLFLLVMVAALVTASCSKDNNEGPDDSKLELGEGYLMIRIDHSTFSKQAKTRVADSGIAAERNINSVHIFLFNQDGVGAPTVAHMDPTHFTTTPAGVTTLNTPLRVSAKDKWGYVGVNLTDEMIAQINGLRNNLTNVGFTQTIAELANVAGESFVMFTEQLNISADDIYLSETEANNAPVGAVLRRLAVKAGVYYNNTIYEGDGTYAEGEAEFAWKRINTQIYYVQQGDFRDPNYNPGELLLANQDNSQPYVSLNDDASSIVNFQYATENTFDYENPAIRTDDATCISIRIPFQPANYTVNNAGTWEAQPNTNTPAYDAPDFYTVRVNGGTTYYFSDNATAQQFWQDAAGGGISIGGIQVSPDEPNYIERRYVNGVCYYNVYPNNNGIIRAEMYRYNIFRNQYYRMALRKLTAPGEPNWDFDNGQEITEYGYIQFNLTVEDWEAFDEDIYM